eukprot:3075822-Rhodomonas_salina.2
MGLETASVEHTAVCARLLSIDQEDFVDRHFASGYLRALESGHMAPDERRAARKFCDKIKERQNRPWQTR